MSVTMLHSGGALARHRNPTRRCSTADHIYLRVATLTKRRAPSDSRVRLISARATAKTGARSGCAADRR
jgi:hypothetical protein